MVVRAIVVLLIILLPMAMTFAAEPVKPISPEVEKAVLAEDWTKVFDLLKDVDPTSPSPVTRLIKGHACLALNRNNDSLRLFVSTLDNESRNQWQQWTDRLAESHKTNAVALYLQGDAFARRKVWDAASLAFDQALKMKPAFYLALNARGVVAHAVGNTVLARTYYMKASQAKNSFSDAFTSRGTLSVYENSVGGEQYFEQARRLSSDQDPALSLLGLGAMEYGKQEYSRASDYFNVVSNVVELRQLIQRNRLGVNLARLDRVVRQAKAVGTTLKAIEVQSSEGPIQIEVEQRSQGLVFASAKNGWHITCSVSCKWDIGLPGIDVTGGGTISGGASGGNQGSGGNTGGGEGLKSDQEKDKNKQQESSQFSPVPTEELDELIFITRIAEELESSVYRQVTTGVLNSNPIVVLPGGADSNPTAARSNRGKWGVSTVYGLLYAVQESPENILFSAISGIGNK